jgi:probable F420-dependent oxidoreductase
MTSPRAFRFGIQASAAPSRQAWVEIARKVEDLGYAALTVADHLDDQFATTPALMAAADATTTLRLGALVYANDYHHPVVLAKEAATLDLLSEGRLELGLGAGWQVEDYEQAGIPLDRPSVRIARLAEAVTVVKGLLSDDPCTFAGDHYRVTGMRGTPTPLQRPHPPILIGGGGRRILTLAAREADIIGLNIDMRSGHIDEPAGPTATADSTDQKLQWIRDEAGDRFDEIELQVRIHLTMVSDDRQGVAEMVGPVLGLTPAQALESPHALVGTEAEIVDQLLERRERFGISYIGLSVDALDAMAPIVAKLAGT